mmetsp:Transcript_2411/g.3171  ORF Transcript_2411/g.3171 Transcript_2411/m.3171 type:complete len:101 (-) Transcript_2411:191-493(-)
MSMYIRAKRTNQTIFLYVEPSETVTDVRKKISAIIKTPVDNVRLLSTNKTPLDDAKTLAESKIENDSVVFWVQKKEGTEEWEQVNLQKIEASKPEDKTDS